MSAWDRTGQTVFAEFLNTTGTATVTDSRVKYGGSVQHTLLLTVPVTVAGESRTHALVSEDAIMASGRGLKSKGNEL